MKKLVLWAIALVALSFATSCQRDFLEVIGLKGTVTFTVQTPGAETKVIGDGENVDIVYYEIYKDEQGHKNSLTGTPLVKGSVEMSGKKATLPLNLLEDEEYVALFWAQVGAQDCYDVRDLRAVEVDYSDAAANDESRAAFYKSHKFTTHDDADRNVSVTLYRPFAQLNLGTTTESLEIDYLVTLDQSKVVVDGVASVFNVAKETTASGAGQKVTFDFATVPAKHDPVEILTVNGKTYEYVSMNYFLVPSDEGTVVVEYDIMTDVGTVNRTVSNVPAKKNYRTNILGNLLTKETVIEVVVDKEFNTPDLAPIQDYVVNGKTYEVYTAAGLAKFAYMANNSDNTLNLELMNDIELPAFEIAEDAANQTYVYTDTPITVTDGVPSGSNWVPLGHYYDKATMFVGKIDGGGKTVSGLYVNNGSNNYAGFIGLAQTGTCQEDSNPDAVFIKDLNITNSVVYSTAAAAGVLAGMVQNIKGVQNCHVLNSSVIGGSYTGGLIGYVYSRETDVKVVVSDCSVDGDSFVKGKNQIGGIAGRNDGGVVLHSSNAADVYGNTEVGGVAGRSCSYQGKRSGYIIACTNAGNISGNNDVGGIVGWNYWNRDHKGAEVVVIASASTAESVDSDKAGVGLIAGYLYNNSALEKNTLHIGSWALKTSEVTEVLGRSAGCAECKACYAFDSAASITQADVDAMNAAIADYNSGRTPADQSYCPYTWNWTEGSLPVLQ